MLKLNLILAIICYSVVLIFAFLMIYRVELKIYWKRIKLLLYIGFAAHTFGLMSYFVLKNHFPIISNIEALLLMSWLLVPLILFIEWKNRSMIMSVVLLPFVILALFAILIINSPMAFLSPKLKSYWMYIHVPTSLLAILFLFISFGASLMYLVQNNAIKLKKPGFLYDKLPSLAQCDLINYNSIWIGFILISIGMISGMLWSKKCFGEFWQWDIKEILTLLVWIVYLIILIYRLYMKWTAKIIAYLSIIGFLLILITFLGYAYISKSYHSF